MTLTPEAVVRAWNDAFARRDIDECLSYMSDDYRRRGEPSWEPPMSKESWAIMLKGFSAAWPDWKWEVTSLAVSDGTVIVEATESGTWTHPYEVFPGLTLEPTNETYLDHDAVFFVVDEGLITESRVYITSNFNAVYKLEERVTEALAAQGTSLADGFLGLGDGATESKDA